MSKLFFNWTLTVSCITIWATIVNRARHLFAVVQIIAEARPVAFRTVEINIVRKRAPQEAVMLRAQHARKRKRGDFHWWRTGFEESVTHALNVQNLQTLSNVQECLNIVLVDVYMRGVHVVQYLANATDILDDQVKYLILLTGGILEQGPRKIKMVRETTNKQKDVLCILLQLNTSKQKVTWSRSWRLPGHFCVLWSKRLWPPACSRRGAPGCAAPAAAAAGTSCGWTGSPWAPEPTPHALRQIVVYLFQGNSFLTLPFEQKVGKLDGTL